MDYALTEQQEMLKKASREFLEKECPKALVRELEESETGYSPELWKKMAALGWMGLSLPEKYGGSGLTFVDLAILLEEMGRALVPGPFLGTVVGGLGILRWGSEQQKKKFLPRIAQGELKIALALLERSASYEAAGIKTKAEADGKGFIINGKKLFVTYGQIADYFLCVARTKNTRDREFGITVFLVDAGSPGVKVTPLKSFTEDRPCEVAFNKVRVAASDILGKPDAGWPVAVDIMELSALAECPWMVGGAQQVLELSVAYAKERVQFDRPIGSFQAVQHKCANVAVDVAGARDITYQTAWKFTEGLPYKQDISISKAWTSETYRKACVEGIQIHGGIGITRDYDVQLYYRRAKAAEMSFGDADYHLEMIARHMGL